MIAALSVLIGTLALIVASLSLRTIHDWWTDPTRRWYRHLWFVEHHLCRPTSALAAQVGAGPHVKVTAGRLTGPVPSVTLTGDSSAAHCVEPPQSAPELNHSGAGSTPPTSTAVAGDSQPPVAPVTVPRAGREGIPAGSFLPGVPLPVGPTTPAPGRARGVPRPGVGHHDEAGHEQLPHRDAGTTDPRRRQRPPHTQSAGRHSGDRDRSQFLPHGPDGGGADRPAAPHPRVGADSGDRAGRVAPQPPVAVDPPEPAAAGPHPGRVA